MCRPEWEAWQQQSTEGQASYLARLACTFSFKRLGPDKVIDEDPALRKLSSDPVTSSPKEAAAPLPAVADALAAGDRQNMPPSRPACSAQVLNWTGSHSAKHSPEAFGAAEEETDSQPAHKKARTVSSKSPAAPVQDAEVTDGPAAAAAADRAQPDAEHPQSGEQGAACMPCHMLEWARFMSESYLNSAI